MPELELAVAVDDAIFDRHPDYVAVVLVAAGVQNGPTDAATDAALGDAEEQLRASGLQRAADHPHIAAWRAAFSAFGAKPSKYPCSVEALASRVFKGHALPRVNRLVDLYNAVSVRHLLPVGGEDADRLAGSLRLTPASGDETFDPRGDHSLIEPVNHGEVIWRDDLGVTCRRWNWRQGARTQLTDHTTNAFFVLDRLDGLPVANLHAAADELAARLGEHWPQARIGRVVRAGAEALA